MTPEQLAELDDALADPWLLSREHLVSLARSASDALKAAWADLAAMRERAAKTVEGWDCSCATTCQCYRLAAAIRAIPLNETEAGHHE